MVGVSARAKISTIQMDADLVMGAYNITLGVGQTVDGKDVSEELSALQGIVFFHREEIEKTGIDNEKFFEVRARGAGKVYVEGEHKYAVNTAMMELWVNGVHVEDILNMNQVAYTAFTFVSTAAVNATDLVQLYMDGLGANSDVFCRYIKLSIETGGQ